MQLQCRDVTPDCHRREMVHDNLQVFHFVWTPTIWSTPIPPVVPPELAQVDNGRQTHLVHLLFDCLRSPSQHDRPASRPSPAPILTRYTCQNFNETQRRQSGVYPQSGSRCTAYSELEAVFEVLPRTSLYPAGFEVVWLACTLDVVHDAHLTASFKQSVKSFREEACTLNQLRRDGRMPTKGRTVERRVVILVLQMNITASFNQLLRD